MVVWLNSSTTRPYNLCNKYFTVILDEHFINIFCDLKISTPTISSILALQIQITCHWELSITIFQPNGDLKWLCKCGNGIQKQTKLPKIHQFNIFMMTCIVWLCVPYIDSILHNQSQWLHNHSITCISHDSCLNRGLMTCQCGAPSVNATAGNEKAQWNAKSESTIFDWLTIDR